MTNPTTTRPAARFPAGLPPHRGCRRGPGAGRPVRGRPGGRPPDLLIGYTEFRTDLPGGRYVNVATMRAAVVKADGTGRRVLAEELTREKNSWTPVPSAGRRTARPPSSRRGWKSDENGKWEEEHKDFRFSNDGFSSDGYLFDLATGKATNVTAVERVSHYNVCLQFWPPGDPTKLRFLALVDGVNRPLRHGPRRQEQARADQDSPNLVHGMSVSPDGKRGAYEDAGLPALPRRRGRLQRQSRSRPASRSTSCRPWSPDGAWVLFVAGEHYDCHPHVVKADGTGLKKLASRNGYRGVIDFLDVPDFHDGSSDLPVWAPDSKSVFYTAKVGSNVELFRVPLDGKSEQLTDTPAGSMHYHPAPSPDGKWLLYGSKRDGVRQLYVMRLSDKKEWRITDLAKGRAAMWAVAGSPARRGNARAGGLRLPAPGARLLPNLLNVTKKSLPPYSSEEGRRCGLASRRPLPENNRATPYGVDRRFRRSPAGPSSADGIG